MLEHWQQAFEADLRRALQTNLGRLAEHLNWERFVRQVEEALTSDLPPTQPIGRVRRIALAATAATSPYGLLRPQGRRLAVAALRQRLAADGPH